MKKAFFFVIFNTVLEITLAQKFTFEIADNPCISGTVMYKISNFTNEDYWILIEGLGVRGAVFDNLGNVVNNFGCTFQERDTIDYLKVPAYNSVLYEFGKTQKRKIKYKTGYNYFFVLEYYCPVNSIKNNSKIKTLTGRYPFHPYKFEGCDEN